MIAAYATLKKAAANVFCGIFPEIHEVRFAAMTSSWQMETGNLVCRWSESDQRAPYFPLWMQEAPEIHGGYLPPVPDFASHSPFGGATWFQRYTRDRDSELVD